MAYCISCWSSTAVLLQGRGRTKHAIDADLQGREIQKEEVGKAGTDWMLLTSRLDLAANVKEAAGC